MQIFKRPHQSFCMFNPLNINCLCSTSLLTLLQSKLLVNKLVFWFSRQLTGFPFISVINLQRFETCLSWVMHQSEYLQGPFFVTLWLHDNVVMSRDCLISFSLLVCREASASEQSGLIGHGSDILSFGDFSMLTCLLSVNKYMNPNPKMPKNASPGLFLFLWHCEPLLIFASSYLL